MRKAIIIGLLLAVAGGGVWFVAAPVPPANATEITVYKSPWCGCCKNWIAHLRDNGFAVTVHEREDLDPIRREHGVPEALGSCHTASVEGYTVEGHVPAADIHRLLTERPKARGLAAPGMPVGSPGMEVDNEKEPYNVVLFNDAGKHGVFARH